MWSQGAEDIQQTTLQLMKRQGLEYFQSLTTDKGSEFSTLSLIEEEADDIKVFFTHAHASWEKGRNARHNGLLREFIPKGQSLRDPKYTDLQKYTEAINHRPDKILNDKSSKEKFATAYQDTQTA